MGRKLTKKELKAPDEFTQSLRELLEFASKNRNTILAVASLFFAVLIAITVYNYIKHRKVEKANASFFKVISSNDTGVLDSFAREFSGTFLGEGARFKEIALLIKMGELNMAEKRAKDIEKPLFSGFSFFFKNAKDYISASVAAAKAPEEALSGFEKIRRGDSPFLKSVSLFREAVLKDMRGSEDAEELYRELAQGGSFGFLKSYVERRYLYLKNQ